MTTITLDDAEINAALNNLVRHINNLQPAMDSIGEALVGLIQEQLGRGELIKSEVSEYAGTNIEEFIAESWGEYRNNPLARETSKRVGEIIFARYRAKFGK